MTTALIDLPVLAVGTAGALGILTTGLVLGFRHGFDWDHIAAITDITSTTGAADAEADGERLEEPPRTETGHAIGLGTLYALGHAAVVLALGLLAIAFGAILPDWVDPIMSRVVGVTLVVLGVYVFVSLWQHLRGGPEFRLRSRWMLVFDGARYTWRRFRARLHGHAHVEPVEVSAYGARTAFGVGMIHGVGAETGTQALLIAAVGGAAGAGLGVPMLLAFVVGLVVANTVIVVVSATGFVAARFRQPVTIAIGVLAGVFSIVIGLSFLAGADALLPNLEQLLGGDAL